MGNGRSLNSSGVHRLPPALEEDEICEDSRGGNSGADKLDAAGGARGLEFKDHHLQQHSQLDTNHSLVLHPSAAANSSTFQHDQQPASQLPGHQADPPQAHVLASHQVSAGGQVSGVHGSTVLMASALPGDDAAELEHHHLQQQPLLQHASLSLMAGPAAPGGNDALEQQQQEEGVPSQEVEAEQQQPPLEERYMCEYAGRSFPIP
jgi:hypothetical protein